MIPLSDPILSDKAMKQYSVPLLAIAYDRVKRHKCFEESLSQVVLLDNDVETMFTVVEERVVYMSYMLLNYRVVDAFHCAMQWQKDHCGSEHTIQAIAVLARLMFAYFVPSLTPLQIPHM